ncbi:MAG TPA: DUF4082 domain-containing protein, partial [Verrucomicrobiota bacterium]|nr:DUF4082 domain-containing protein [Verrucomicrobiota bacterium]
MNSASINSNAFQLRDGDSNLVSAVITYDSSTFTATLVDGPLDLLETYTVTVKGGTHGVADLAGNRLEQDLTWSFTTVAQVPTSIWNDDFVPAITSASDDNPVELGVKFRSALPGYVTAIRFYKGSANTGTHVGNLWTTSGQSLASVTFSNETASGWQEQALSTPVAIDANTTYVVSYHAPNGRYSVNGTYFSSSGFENYPLRALADGEEGGNALAKYGPSSFPDTTFNAANYWVDIVFVEDLTPDTTPPQITSVSPPNGASSVSLGSSLVVNFNEAVASTTINTNTIQLRNPSNDLVPATVSYNPSLLRATLLPSESLQLGVTYTATVKGGESGVTDTSTNALASDHSWSFATTDQTSASLWSATNEPAINTAADTAAVALGMKFRSDVAGQITGIRYYRGTNNPGPHVGRLWTAGGTELASVTFVGESSSGWQEQALTNPVVIAADTTYVVSYHAPEGGDSVTHDYFAAGGYTNGPLRALGSVEAGGNGVATYGGASAFPSTTYGAGPNYWVDVTFVEGVPGDETPPQITSVSPTNGAMDVELGSVVTVTFDEAMSAATINTNTIFLLDAFDQVVPASVSYNAGTMTATLTPTGLLWLGQSYTATVKGNTNGVKDTSGNALAADYEWTFTTTAQLATSLWEAAVTPANPAFNDPDATAQGIELGVKVRSAIPGRLVGIQFYKGSNNT